VNAPVTQEPLAAKSIDDLPRPRQEWLRWRHGLDPRRPGVALSPNDCEREIAHLLSWRAQRRCTDGHPILDGFLLIATAGDDGRWHLRNEKSWLCNPLLRSPDKVEPTLDGPHTHSDQYPTNPHVRWSFTYTPEEGNSEAARDWHESWTEYRWSVMPTGVEADPGTIKPRHRCPAYDWPPFTASKTAVGRLRSKLIAEFGPTCQGCAARPATYVDHDHRTWLLRGLLCHICNTAIDDCPHLSGCPWGEYLDNPPALRLGLRYPPPDGQRIRRYLAKAELLRRDPLGHLPEWRPRLTRYPHLRRSWSGTDNSEKRAEEGRGVSAARIDGG